MSHSLRTDAARSHTYWSSFVMKPFCSNKGMNSPGDWNPHTGCLHRTKASAPESLWSLILYLGCR